MKKILAMVLALVLVCGLAVAAAAASFDVSTDSDAIQAGQTVEVTVTLDEDIADASQVQIDLEYDWDALTYDEGTGYTLGEGYDFLSVAVSGRKPVIKISWIDLTGATRTLPAGTVITVPFTANAATTVSELQFAIAPVVNGQTVNEDAVSITVCPGHEWYETDRTGSCTEDGVVTETCSICGATTQTEVPAAGHVHTGMADWNEPIYNENYDIIELVQHTCCDVCFEDISTTTYVGINLAMDENWELIQPLVLVPGETPEVAPGESANLYLNNFGGLVVLIYGENITVSVSTPGSMWDPTMTTVEYTPDDGVVTIPVASYAAYVTVTNNGTEAASYKLDAYIPEGDMMNPIVAEPGENTVHVAEDDFDGMYLEFTASCTGWVHITVSGDYWNFNTYFDPDPEGWDDDHYGYYAFDDPDSGDTDSVYMKAGETIRINVGSCYVTEDWEWLYPETDLTVTIVPEYTHEGHIVHVEAVEPGCENEGNIEYWYCECCEMFWQDAELTQLTNAMRVKLPVTHKNIVHVEAVKPGCETEGNIEHWYCADCNMVWIDEDLLQISNHMSVKLGPTHWNIVHVEAVEPTCESDGNIEHWYCADCNMVWVDEDLLQISNHKNVILPATHKNIIHMEAVAPGCHYEGHVEHWYCADCNMLWIDEDLLQISNHKSVILPELGGDVVHVEAKDPTCTENGNIEYWYCEHCEQVWQDEARTQLTNHKNVIVGATGHNFVDNVCTVCGELEVIPEIPEGEVEIEAEKPADYVAGDNGTLTITVEDEEVVVYVYIGDELVATFNSSIELPVTEGVVYTFVTEAENVTLNMTMEPESPKSGDTAISLAVAAAIISAMSIVALPVVKKHF